MRQIGLGHETQSEVLHFRAVNANVPEAVQAQSPLQRLDAAAGEHGSARVRRRTQPDERRAGGRVRPQMTVRRALRERRVEGEEAEQPGGIRDALSQRVRLGPQWSDCSGPT